MLCGVSIVIVIVYDNYLLIFFFIDLKLRHDTKSITRRLNLVDF